jgi:hypothetical protein
MPLIADSTEFKFDHYAKVNLKNGKLHGLIQVFGTVANDPFGHCAGRILTTQLSFIGRFDNGLAKGPCWRGLVGMYR